jgi:hypothetical protein
VHIFRHLAGAGDAALFRRSGSAIHYIKIGMESRATGAMPVKSGLLLASPLPVVIKLSA